ncbi:MAG: TIGR04255 family protein [Solirubrobacteraceae bacterium]
MSVAEPVTFERPPVNEVILSVQHDGPVIDEVGALADFWPTIREGFPGHQKQPPLPPVLEDFSPPGLQAPGVVQFFTGPPQDRYWFITDDETRLIQVQPDRFAFNWRQVPGREAYPRYRELRPEFEERYRTFLDCLTVDAPRPTWCEITYINHVEAQSGADGLHGPLSRILRGLNPEVTSPTLPPIEDTQLQQRFRILDTTGEPIGRFYLTAVPAFRAPDVVPIYVITLIARGKPADTSLEAVLGFFDFGRDLIVNGFKESTTDEMHRLWGLET